jgi:D-alanine-D-alanine ligase
VKILVLGGGDSPEREVSLRSAKSVAEAARQAGFEVVEADPKDGLAVLNEASNDTLVFPILHGKNGEDGILQKQLEAANLPFLGSDSRSSEACFDKWITRQNLEAAGITIPAGAIVNKREYENHPITKNPHVLKINHGGSSIGTLIARHVQKVSPADVNDLFEMEDHAVLEQLIEGTEITVPILDTKALPVIEIVPPVNGEFDYENKYNGQSAEICPPESVSEDIQKQAQELAEKVHKTMGCRHLSRVDIMIDKTGRLFVLEINTMPGMTDQSLYPKSAAVSGIPMPQLVKKFAELVVRDYGL